jgi:hypothetical protein
LHVRWHLGLAQRIFRIEVVIMIVGGSDVIHRIVSFFAMHRAFAARVPVEPE